LRDVTGLRRAVEIEGVAGGEKIADLVHLHGWTSPMPGTYRPDNNSAFCHARRQEQNLRARIMSGGFAFEALGAKARRFPAASLTRLSHAETPRHPNGVHHDTAGICNEAGNLP
jgi:hypothetical protein